MRRLRQDPGEQGRRVQPELLDELPADDPRARRSRRDLQRLNVWMGHRGIWTRQLARLGSPPASIVELGAGDGTLFIRIARALSSAWVGARLQLIDQQALVQPETLTRFKQLGWEARAVRADVFEWLARHEPVDLVTANLFLHHFEDARLAELLSRVARSARVFAACEPRRLRRPEWASLLVRLMGGNFVTRHDAVVSVRAGFHDRELSALWPEGGRWELEEGPAGLFSHFLLARRQPR